MLKAAKLKYQFSQTKKLPAIKMKGVDIMEEDGIVATQGS